MNDALRELYQEVILDHSKRPRNLRKMENPAHHAEGYNPLCGDRVTVYLDEQEGVLEDVSFEGAGCAICMASTSLMTEALKGKTVEEAEPLFRRFHSLLTQEGAAENIEGLELGKLAVFAGVKAYPVRVKCATLPWHTFHAAIHDQKGTVKTEE